MCHALHILSNQLEWFMHSEILAWGYQLACIEISTEISQGIDGLKNSQGRVAVPSNYLESPK